MQTNIKDINTFISNKFSLRNIAESMLPKTGTRKILFGHNGDLIASDKKKLEIGYQK